jgi:hypothetical protein
MATFKEYLAESKKTYNFKVKVAGECAPKASETIKIALSEFDCTSVSKPKRTPITETPLDFPNEKFTHVNIFDVACNYPTTSQMLAAKIAEKLKVHASCVRVRSEFEESEQNANTDSYKRIGTSTEALLNKPYEDTPAAYQNLVGEKRLSFLQELGKVKHAGEQYKGVNDQLLAKGVPTGSSPKEKGR